MSTPEQLAATVHEALLFHDAEYGHDPQALAALEALSAHIAQLREERDCLRKDRNVWQEIAELREADAIREHDACDGSLEGDRRAPPDRDQAAEVRTQ